MRNALVAVALTLMAFPALAFGPMIVDQGEAIIIEDVAGGTAAIFDHPRHGPMIIIHGVDLRPDEEISSIIIRGVAFGPMMVTEGVAFGPMIVDQGNNFGPMIVDQG